MITRRQFLHTAAATAAGLLLGGIVKAETPAEVEDIQAVPLKLSDVMSESGSIMVWAPMLREAGNTYEQKVLSTDPIMYWREPEGVMLVPTFRSRPTCSNEPVTFKITFDDT